MCPQRLTSFVAKTKSFEYQWYTAKIIGWHFRGPEPLALINLILY